MPKKIEIFSLKIHKSAGIFFKNPKPFQIKVINIKKMIWDV